MGRYDHCKCEEVTHIGQDRLQATVISLGRLVAGLCKILTLVATHSDAYRSSHRHSSLFYELVRDDIWRSQGHTARK